MFIEKSKCIYCLFDKSIEEFNVEHVVPRAFGRYKNALTLHKHQVCEECNTYFSKTFETAIAIDSLEALLRMTKSCRIMSDGRCLQDGRINVYGDSGVFKGVKFRVITDQKSEEKVTFFPYPTIGLKTFEHNNEYEYFVPEKLPANTQEISDKLKRTSNSIIFWSMEKEEVDRILIQKGYTVTECKLGASITDLYSEPELETQIKVNLDSIIRRFVAKTAFNYLTFKFGKDYVLLNRFDAIRNFIRYGTLIQNIRFSFSHGRVMNFSDQKDSHILGLAWEDKRFKSIHGIVSWFNEATYTIWLCNNESGLSYKLPFSIFNNLDKLITDTKECYVI